MQEKRIIESGYREEILDEGKVTATNEAINKVPRDLQSDDEVSSCEGTLFQLKINLDFFAEETAAWELGETTPDDIIVFFNYTSDLSSTTSDIYTACTQDTAQGGIETPALPAMLPSQLCVVDFNEVSNTIRSSKREGDNLHRNKIYYSVESSLI